MQLKVDVKSDRINQTILQSKSNGIPSFPNLHPASVDSLESKLSLKSRVQDVSDKALVGDPQVSYSPATHQPLNSDSSLNQLYLLTTEMVPPTHH